MLTDNILKLIPTVSFFFMALARGVCFLLGGVLESGTSKAVTALRETQKPIPHLFPGPFLPH